MKKKIAFIAIGQAGGNIGQLFEERGFSVLYLNTSEEDLSTLSGAKYKYHITGGEGCNKDRKKAKQLVIDEIELLECRLDDPEPMIQIRVVCSKGTYIRALARDIGEALHSGAHLTGLIRTRVGDVRLEDCLNPEHFKEWIDGQEIENEEENN